jgi:hypothetical protein
MGLIAANAAFRGSERGTRRSTAVLQSRVKVSSGRGGGSLRQELTLQQTPGLKFEEPLR